MDQREPSDSKPPEVSFRYGPRPGPRVRTPGVWGQLWMNLRAGQRLLYFVPVRREHFAFSFDQAALLLAVAVATAVVIDFFAVEPVRIFNGAGFGYVAGAILSALLGCYLVARIERRPSGFSDVVVGYFCWVPATAPVVILFQSFESNLETGLAVWLMLSAIAAALWYFAVIVRVVRAVFDGGLVRSACLAILLSAVQIPFLLQDDQRLWVTRYVPDAQSNMAEALSLDVEQTYYDQLHIFDRAFETLEPNRPGVVDLYFVGFGSYAYQDVFLREVRSVRELFDERFDTAGRSLALINNRATVEELPLASVTNLWWALSGLPNVMDPEEDVVFLFLTSHGSRDHRLSVEFWPLGLNDLSAEELDGLLDDAGIKWRVIVVSACYSGGFLDALKDENSLIMTAARRDRTSFGCGQQRDYTYFGEAYFDQQLRGEVSFIEAFYKAADAIAARESAEGLPASEPQIHIGSRIAAKLKAIEARAREVRDSPGPAAAARP